MSPRATGFLRALAYAVAAAGIAAPRAGASPEGDRPGRVEMSDGTVLEGKLFFTARVLLHIVDPATGRGRDVDPSTVASLAFRVDKESVERPYTFLKPGGDEKTYGEGLYPVREILCTITLASGDRLDGHLKSTVVYVDRGEGGSPTRVVLRRQWKGTVGQTLDDLVYAREVRFLAGPEGAKPEAEPARGSIEARVTGGGEALFAAALGHASRLVYVGEAVAGSTLDADGVARFEGLPPDAYDLVVRVRRGVAAGTAPAGKATLRPLIDAEDRPALLEIVTKGDDIYDERTLLASGGDRDGCRLVVAKRVRRRTTNDSAFGRGQALFAVDVWSAHRLEREWRIDGRANLLRIILADGEEPPPVVPLALLAGVRVEAGARASCEARWPGEVTGPGPGSGGGR